MIASIENMKAALTGARDNFDGTVINVCKLYEPEIIDMNTDQLNRGIRGDGTRIEPDYTPFTIRLKKLKNQPLFPTLRDKGGFHDGFFVNLGGDYLALGSSDEKALKLERKYGREIYGLTDENIEELGLLIIEDFCEEQQKQIFG